MGQRMRSRHTSAVLMIRYRNPCADILEQKREGGVALEITALTPHDAHDCDPGSCSTGSSLPYLH